MGESEAEAAEKQRDASRVWALDQLLALGRATLQRAGSQREATRRQSAGQKLGDEERAAVQVTPAAQAAAAVATPLALVPRRTLRCLFCSAFWEWPEPGGAPQRLVNRYGGRPTPPLSPSYLRPPAPFPP